MPVAIGSVIAARYRLERPLAQGGMGSVWRAHDVQLDAPVAIKLMAPALAASADARNRFEREAKAAAQLRSPHVVSVFGHGVHEDTPYMVLELLEGEDLGARLRRKRTLGLSETLAILTATCKALRRAHEAGVVHRDLKPANIFLTRVDDDEVVKVLDFGIAKVAPAAAGGENTRTGVVMGSPSYMSPEQVRSAKGVDQRSDLWSLGLVLFRMVTGRVAFVGETDTDILVRICSDPIPVPSEVAPGLPPSIDAFFAKALQRDPDQRFQSAKEMAEAFEQAVGVPASLPIPTTQPSSAVSEPAPSPGERTLPLAVSAQTYAPTAPLTPAVLPAPPRPEVTVTNAGSSLDPRREKPGAVWLPVLGVIGILGVGGVLASWLMSGDAAPAAEPIVVSAASAPEAPPVPTPETPPAPTPTPSASADEPTPAPTATAPPAKVAPKPASTPAPTKPTSTAKATESPPPAKPKPAPDPFATRVDEKP